MTKIHIVPQGSEAIDGYEKIEVVNGTADLTRFARNECDFILASDILDEMTVDSAPDFIQLLESKTRKGGKICIGGSDINLISRAVITGELDVAEANKTIFHGRSCLSLESVQNLLTSLNLKIKTTSFQGYRYEIEAIR